MKNTVSMTALALRFRPVSAKMPVPFEPKRRHKGCPDSLRWLPASHQRKS
jgi:hypothetical protein